MMLPFTFWQSAAVVDQPPVAGYALWLDTLRANSLYQDTGASVLATLGTTVGAWQDPTTGITATQSTSSKRPTVASNGLTFDGSDDALTLSANVSLTAGVDFAVFYVSQMPVATDSGIMSNAGTSMQLRIAQSVNSYSMFDGSANPTSSPRSAAQFQARGVRCYQRTGTNIAFYEGLTSVGSASQGVSRVFTFNQIAAFGTSFYFPGTLASILIYATALTSQQRIDTTTWLQTRHSA